MAADGGGTVIFRTMGTRRNVREGMGNAGRGAVDGTVSASITSLLPPVNAKRGIVPAQMISRNAVCYAKSMSR